MRNYRKRGSDWMSYFVYRKECWKTTWLFRLGFLLLIVGIAFLTRNYWTVKLGESLACSATPPQSDALLLENFDPDFMVFERARDLLASGVARRVLVPIAQDKTTKRANPVAIGIMNVMASSAQLPTPTVIPIPEVEPISLNAAREIRSFLVREKIPSITVVSPGFRSRRSELVYRTVLNPAGISVGCVPVFRTSPVNWTQTWHGIEDLLEQFVKLAYYRLYVLPRFG